MEFPTPCPGGVSLEMLIPGDTYYKIMYIFVYMKEYFITPEEFAVNASFVFDKIEEMLNGPDYGRFKKFRNRITETKPFNNYGYTMLSGEETSYGSYHQYIKF